MIYLEEEEQIKIMEGQLNHFESLFDKMMYLHRMFDNDPMFSKKSRDIVRSNIAKKIQADKIS